MISFHGVLRGLGLAEANRECAWSNQVEASQRWARIGRLVMSLEDRARSTGISSGYLIGVYDSSESWDVADDCRSRGVILAEAYASYGDLSVVSLACMDVGISGSHVGVNPGEKFSPNSRSTCILAALILIKNLMSVPRSRILNQGRRAAFQWRRVESWHEPCRIVAQHLTMKMERLRKSFGDC